MAREGQARLDRQLTPSEAKLGLVGAVLLVASLGVACQSCGEDERTAPVGQRLAPEPPAPTEAAEEPPKKEAKNPAEWWEDKLKTAPLPPQGLSLAEAERIHRFLDVSRFNSGGDQGMRHGTDYKGAAEQLNIHVDVLRAADSYVHYERMKYLSAAVKELLDMDPELEADYYHPMQETAVLGNYTIHAKIVLQACKDEPELEERARDAARRLLALAAPVADGFKIGRVRYHCGRLGTDGDLERGFIGGGGKLRQMPPCSGTAPNRPSKDTAKWCARAWNDGKVVEH